MNDGPPLKLFLLRNGTVKGYDVYDACVVAAVDSTQAKQISLALDWNINDKITWRYVGLAHDDMKPGIVISSYNAG